MNEVDHQHLPVREMQPLFDCSSEEDMQPLRIRRRRCRVDSSPSKNLHDNEEIIRPVEEELRPLRKLRLRGALLSHRRVKALYLKMRRNGAFSYVKDSSGKDDEEWFSDKYYDLEYLSPEDDDEWFFDDIGWSHFPGEESEPNMYEAKHQHHLVHEMQPAYDYYSEEELEPLRIQRRRVASSSKNLHDKEEEDPSPIEELRPLRKLRLRASSSHKRAKALFLKMKRNGAFSYKKKSHGKGPHSKTHFCDAALFGFGAGKAYQDVPGGESKPQMCQIVVSGSKAV